MGCTAIKIGRPICEFRHSTGIRLWLSHPHSIIDRFNEPIAEGRNPDGSKLTKFPAERI
jgi:hypothetical protein